MKRDLPRATGEAARFLFREARALLPVMNPRPRNLWSAPGTLAEPERPAPAAVDAFVFDASECNVVTDSDPAQARSLCQPGKVVWLNVSGVADTAVLRALGEQFDLHPLVVEDIANPSQRPKLEDHGRYLYLVVKMIRLRDGAAELDTEQVSLVLGKGFVISFQERPGDVFDPVRERLRSGAARVRSHGADYLCYALVDAIVDHYFVVLEGVGATIESIEDQVMSEPEPELLRALHRLRGAAIFLRRSVWPLRELLRDWERLESELLADATRPFIRDACDHTIQVADSIDTCRDLLSGLFDMYLSVVSNRMNEVMQMLTLIATIFIPITFIAGIYGMNFKDMPELEWRWGYPVALAVMAAIAGGMILFFRRKRWL